MASKLSKNRFFDIKNGLAWILLIFEKFVVNPIFWVECRPIRSKKWGWPWIFRKSIKSKPNDFLHRKNGFYSVLGPFGELFELFLLLLLTKKSGVQWRKHHCLCIDTSSNSPWGSFSIFFCCNSFSIQKLFHTVF